MKYELTALVDPKPANVKSVSSIVTKHVEALKGKIVKTRDWGKQEFYHKVGKLAAGTPLYFVIELEPSQIRDFEARLRLEDKIVRYLLIKES